MLLGTLIEILKRADQSAIVPHGFANPHSYRGYYERLAFEPADGVTVASMLLAATEANGSSYGGWKGGDFRMHEDTPVHLATEGCTGAELTESWLADALAGGGITMVHVRPVMPGDEADRKSANELIEAIYNLITDWKSR